MKKMFKFLAVALFSFSLVTNAYCAWDKTKPADNEKLKDTPALIRANWDAIELGTDSALFITNAKVSPTAAIADTKLAQITTANKVSTSAITGTLGIANGGTGLTSAGGTANRILGTTNGSTFSLLQVDVSSAMITGTLPIANGGTGITSAGGVANRVLLTTNGTAWSAGQVALATMVTGTLPTGNGGTGTTANANAASGVVVLDASSRLPAVDGSQLTGLSAGGYTGMQVFTSNGTWTKPAGINKVLVKVIGGGGGGRGDGSVGDLPTAGGNSTFAGSSVTVTGGGGGIGTPGSGGAGGNGSNGSLNISGYTGVQATTLVYMGSNRAYAGGILQILYGLGGVGKGSGYGGGGGGYSEGVIEVNGNVNVVVGAGGTGGYGGGNGTAGLVIVYW